LSHLDPKEIKFVIDKDSLIQELDEKNNIAIVKPDSSA
jgi:subtilase family serine protease